MTFLILLYISECAKFSTPDKKSLKNVDSFITYNGVFLNSILIE